MQDQTKPGPWEKGASREEETAAGRSRRSDGRCGGAGLPGGQGRGAASLCLVFKASFSAGKRESHGSCRPLRRRGQPGAGAGGAEAGSCPAGRHTGHPGGACAPSSLGTGVCIPTRPPPRTLRAPGGPVGAARASRAGPEQPPRVLATVPGSGVGTRDRCGPGRRQPARTRESGSLPSGDKPQLLTSRTQPAPPPGSSGSAPPGPRARLLTSL